MWGMSESDLQLTFELWGEHLQAWECFAANSTQWRVGMNGVYGLDYGPCYQWCADEGLTGSDRRRVMSEVRLIESGALQEIQEQTSKKA